MGNSRIKWWEKFCTGFATNVPQKQLEKSHRVDSMLEESIANNTPTKRDMTIYIYSKPVVFSLHICEVGFLIQAIIEMKITKTLPEIRQKPCDKFLTTSMVDLLWNFVRRFGKNQRTTFTGFWCKSHLLTHYLTVLGWLRHWYIPNVFRISPDTITKSERTQ